MGMVKEFKTFALKGNVMNLAVGIIIGAAFGAIVASFVPDVIMPPIGILIVDGGILFGGENSYMEPGESDAFLSGMISRNDSLGNELWRDYVYNSGCIIIYSARQLSQGGYIAAGMASSPENGNQGFLIRYAPELGIEDEGSLPAFCGS